MTYSKQHRKKLSQHQKFRKASILTTELASVASEASNMHFERCIDTLRQLLAFWKNGDEVALTKVDLTSTICVFECDVTIVTKVILYNVSFYR